MGKYQIFPLHVGDIVRDNTNMMYMVEPGKKITIPLLAWLLFDGEHYRLVDTGGTPADGVHYMPYTQAPGCTLEEQLSGHGVSPQEIDTVILTHLHWDHAGNNGLFPHAAFYVQKRELEYAANPLKIQRGAYNYPLIAQTQYKLIDGAQELMDGISVIPTPGHSPGSQSVLVDTARGTYIIAGDLICLYDCMERDPMIINGLHTDLFEYYDSLERVAQTGFPVLPGHEPKILEHIVYP